MLELLTITSLPQCSRPGCLVNAPPRRSRPTSSVEQGATSPTPDLILLSLPDNNATGLIPIELFAGVNLRFSASSKRDATQVGKRRTCATWPKLGP